MSHRPTPQVTALGLAAAVLGMATLALGLLMSTPT